MPVIPLSRLQARIGMGRWAWVVLALLLQLPAQAMELGSLYDAEVDVQRRDTGERQVAFKRALAIVLGRMTGQRDVGSAPGASALLGKAPRYVEQYGYLEGDAGSQAYRLRVRFDAQALEQALIDAGLPVWGRQRPAVLVWLAVKRPDTRYIVAEGGAEPVRGAMEGVAQLRGVPLMFPLLDLQDRRGLSEADILGGFDEPVRQASERYRPDAVLIGRAKGFSDGFWRIDWRLYLGDQGLDWTTEGDALMAAAAEGIQHLATLLGERLAIRERAQQADGVALSVDGVNELEDYARLDAYLGGLDQIGAYHPYRIEAGRITYWLRLKGHARDLEHLISLGDTLERAAPQPGQAEVMADVAGTSTLRYRLRP
jgi:hypothetical protein